MRKGMRVLGFALPVFTLGSFATPAFGGEQIAEAVKKAERAGIGITATDGVPASFKPGNFEVKISLRNLKEEPLRGIFSVKVADSDFEDSTFKVLASEPIDLTLASVLNEESKLMLKGRIPDDCVWRDIKVDIEARDAEITCFSGFVAGEGVRPPRKKSDKPLEKRVVRGEQVTRSGDVVHGDAFFPHGFRAAFISSDGKASDFVNAAKTAGWKVADAFKADESGWKNLAGELARYDAVVSLSGLPGGIEAEAYTHFVSRGGLLWINGVGSEKDIQGLLAFSPMKGLPGVKDREVGQNETDNHLVRPIDGRIPLSDCRELEAPAWGNLVEFVPNTYFEIPRDIQSVWNPVAALSRDRNLLCVIARLRMGRGVLYVSSTPSVDAQFYANLEYFAGLRHLGLAYGGQRCDIFPGGYPESSRFRNPATFEFGMCNVGPSNATYRLRVTATAEDGKKTLWKTYENVKPGLCAMRIDLDCFGLHGKTSFEMTFEDLATGYRIKKDVGMAERPRYLVVKPPMYRGWVSEKRAVADVTVGVVIYDDADVGKPVSLETYDTGGKLLAKQDGVVAQGPLAIDKGAWFQVPVPANAPTGRYKLIARTVRDGEPVEAASYFEIRSVVPKQVFLDQDGTLMNEGRRFYGLGAYHLGKFDDPVGPWNYDTNRHEMVVSPDCLKEDGTPFTLWDVGINFTQCWEGDWDLNFCSDTNRLARRSPIDILWALKGRGSIDLERLTHDYRNYYNACRDIVTNNPSILTELATKNNARARKASEKGILCCLEQGVPIYVQSLYPGRFSTQWDPALRCEKNDYAEVRKIVRDVLAADKYGTIGGWYTADETGTGPRLVAQHQVLMQEDELHPDTFLGDVSAMYGGDDIGLDQIHPDCGRVEDERLLNGLYQYGTRNRGTYGRHGGSLLVCHRAAGGTRGHQYQNFDTLFTLELSAIISGLNGSLWYTWRESGSPINDYGGGWGVECARSLKKVVDRVKVISPYFLVNQGASAKSRNGRVRARMCGDESTGKIVIYVNFERNQPTVENLRFPELAGKTLEPFFGEGEKVTVDGRGNFRLKLSPDVSGVYRVK